MGPLGRFGLVVAMFLHCLLLSPFYATFFEASHWPSYCGRNNQAAARWQDQPGSSPLAGSTRQQTVGRVNQVADRGDGDGDQDKDEDEIPSYVVLLTASVNRFGVSRMREFLPDPRGAGLEKAFQFPSVRPSV